MASSTLADLIAATAATGGLFYGVQSGADRKFTFTASGAALIEAADLDAQLAILGGGDAPTGTGVLVRATSPTLTTPNLGTPSALTLTNATGLPPAGVNGTAAILGANIFTGANEFSANGATSTPAVKLSGSWLRSSGSTAAQLLVQESGATAFSGSVLGNGLAINSASGFGGFLLWAGTNNAAKFAVDSGGQVYINTVNVMTHNSGFLILGGQSSGVISSLQHYFNDKLNIGNGSSHPTILDAPSFAATLQMGANHATTATDQRFTAHDVSTGTGAAMTVSGGKGSVAGGTASLATSATNGTPRAVVTARADGEVDFPVATAEAALGVASTHKITLYIGATRYKLLAIQE